MAVIASIPGREEALEQALWSLRPQVQQLAVVWNSEKYFPYPASVANLADWIEIQDNRYGSAAKMMYADKWNGLYLGCDDDLYYPEDYADRMWREINLWKQLTDKDILTTTHGRVLKPTCRHFNDAFEVYRTLGESSGHWVNYPGGCGLAFDSRFLRFQLNSDVGQNLEEAWLAVRAQRFEIPIRVIAHSADWLKYLLPKDADTIFKKVKAEDFASRNAVLQDVYPWVVYKP